MSQIKNSFSWQVFQQILRGGVGILVAGIIARSLGERGLGILDSSFALINLTAGLCGLGLQRIITRDFCKNDDRHSRVKGTGFILLSGSSILGFAIINCCFWTSPLEERLVIFTASLLLLIQPFGFVVSSMFEAKGRLDLVAKLMLVGLAISSITKISLALLGAPVYWLTFAYTLDLGLGSILGWFVACRLFDSFKKEWKFCLSTAKSLLAESLPLLLSTMAAFMYTTMDVLMLRWMSGLEETGLYGAAIRISQIPLFLPGILTGVYTAKLMASRNTTGNFATADLTMLARILVGMGFLILVSGWLLGPFTVKILYGVSFSEAGSLLQIHVIGVFFMFIGSMRNHLLVLEGRGKLILLSDICGALMNLVLNLWLIPRHGAMGASVATAISYFTAFFLINVIHPDLRKYNRLLYTAFKKNASFSHK